MNIFSKISRRRPFVPLVKQMGVSVECGMILTGETEVLGEKHDTAWCQMNE